MLSQVHSMRTIKGKAQVIIARQLWKELGMKWKKNKRWSKGKSTKEERQQKYFAQA